MTEIRRWHVNHDLRKLFPSRTGLVVLYDDHRAALEAVEAEAERYAWERIQQRERAEQAEKQLEELREAVATAIKNFEAGGVGEGGFSSSWDCAHHLASLTTQRCNTIHKRSAHKRKFCTTGQSSCHIGPGTNAAIHHDGKFVPEFFYNRQ